MYLVLEETPMHETNQTEGYTALSLENKFCTSSETQYNIFRFI